MIIEYELWAHQKKEINDIVTTALVVLRCEITLSSPSLNLMSSIC